MDPARQKLTDTEPDSEEYQDVHGHRYFGVKSYLHNFYENVARNPTDADDYDDDCSSSVGKYDRKRSSFWTLTLIGGLVSMIGGSVMLVVGFTFPKMKIDIGYQEEMRIIDKSAFDFNVHLDETKVIGLVLFAVGGILVASALLLPSLLAGSEEDGLDESTHFKLRIDNESDLDGINRNLIPITEELKVVQPRQENTTIITNAGLKQIELDTK